MIEIGSGRNEFISMFLIQVKLIFNFSSDTKSWKQPISIEFIHFINKPTDVYFSRKSPFNGKNDEKPHI